MENQNTTLKYLSVGLSVSICLAIVPVSVVLGAPPVTGAPVLVVTPPWVDAGHVIAQAQGQIIGLEHAPLADIAYSDAPDFIDQLKQTGAWLVLDGIKISQLCGIIL